MCTECVVDVWIRRELQRVDWREPCHCSIPGLRRSQCIRLWHDLSTPGSVFVLVTFRWIVAGMLRPRGQIIRPRPRSIWPRPRPRPGPRCIWPRPHRSWPRGLEICSLYGLVNNLIFSLPYSQSNHQRSFLLCIGYLLKTTNLLIFFSYFLATL